MTSDRDPRVRRSSGTVRSLVLRAARELFDERGYEQVSTREIAARAGVTQATLFRQFGSKSRLFGEAVYQPFHDFVVDYLSRWANQGHGSNSSIDDTEAYVSGLYRILLDNRKHLMALMALPDTESDRPAREAGLRETLARLEREVALEIEASGVPTIDVADAVRFSFALVYGMVMLDDAFFPPGHESGDRSRMARQMAGYILRGSRVQA